MMKMKTVALGVAMLVAGSSAYAGDFVTLRDDLPNLTSANGGIINGAQNANADPFRLEVTHVEWLAGYDHPGDPLIDPSVDNSKLIATSISYTANATSRPYPVTGSGVLTLLDYHVSYDVPLADGNAQGTVYDFVFQDSRDNALVFGTRYINMINNNEEVNFLYRYGFNGYDTSVAWLFMSDEDLRLYQVARTDDHSYAASVPFDADAVRMKSDISVSEGNPYGGLFLVKTDATAYTWADKAIGYYQAGEEGQEIVGGYIGGFVPTVAAVPEPSEYALMLVGLGLLGAVARRRKNLA